MLTVFEKKYSSFLQNFYNSPVATNFLQLRKHFFLENNNISFITNLSLFQKQISQERNILNNFVELQLECGGMAAEREVVTATNMDYPPPCQLEVCPTSGRY